MVISFINYEIRVNLERKQPADLEQQEAAISQQRAAMSGQMAGTMAAAAIPQSVVEEAKGAEEPAAAEAEEPTPEEVKVDVGPEASIHGDDDI